MYRRNASVILLTLLAVLSARPAGAVAPEALDIDIQGEVFSVTRFPSGGDRLFLWVAPGYGTSDRVLQMARELAENRVEVWHVDLSENLFLPKSTTTMRSLDGRHVAGLIEAAHARTEKRVTLVSRSYGALPLLKGARRWQLSQLDHENDDGYLAGAILFSPSCTFKV